MQGDKVINYEFDKLMMPFWRSDIMYNESVLMLKDNDGIPSAPLLFKPDKILSVKNLYLNAEYTKVDDWIYEDGMLKLVEGTNAGLISIDELFPPEPRTGLAFPMTGKGYILVDNMEIIKRQLAVTYTHSDIHQLNIEPKWQGNMLPKTMENLTSGKPLKIALYGDSISVGYDISGFLNIPPYMPDWGTLFVESLKRAYHENIALINPSVGGVTAEWGVKNIEELVSIIKPDLVILAFGMNDGTWKVSPESFGKSIKTMMLSVLKYNKDVEFILVSPILPNKLVALQGNRDTSFYGEQEHYMDVLESLTDLGTVAVDMTSVHKELLKYKRYFDMTGNNINHPNDFLARWYAQLVSAVLIR